LIENVISCLSFFGFVCCVGAGDRDRLTQTETDRQGEYTDTRTGTDGDTHEHGGKRLNFNPNPKLKFIPKPKPTSLFTLLLLLSLTPNILDIGRQRHISHNTQTKNKNHQIQRSSIETSKKRHKRNTSPFLCKLLAF